MKRQRGGSTGDLRKRAEERLDLEPSKSPELPTEDADRIIHELRVHQVELEMQNEELRNAQARIEESRAKYSDLYDFAPIGYLTLDEKGLIRQANLAASKQLGIERSHLMHKPFQFYVAKEDREGFFPHLRNLLKTEEPRTFEVKLVNHAGVGLYVRIDGVSVRDSSGAASCNLAVTDISERKRAERSLLCEKDFSGSIIRCLPGVFYLFDEQGKIGRWNQNLEVVSGYSSEEIAAMDPLDFIGEKDRGRVSEAIQAVFAKGYSSVEADFVSKKGHKTPYHLSGNRITIDGKTYLGGVGIDVSERKRAEEELLKAKKLEATGILAGGIAHDFNNLLGVILGHINMAEIDLGKLAEIDPESGERGLEALSNAEQAVFRAMDLTRKFITFSSGGEPCRVSIPVQQLVRDSSALALSGSNIVCECSFGDDLAEVDGDPSQLRQALCDVILNAREAMPRGGTARILAENSRSGSIGVESGLPMGIEKRYVRISIRDEGVGIPGENLPKIFDPYFSTKGRGSRKGMGLGLTTAHSIIKRHNGHIHVESEVGIGTTFVIYLPASEERGAARRETEKRPVGRKGKVLLMDDEETIRNMVCQMIERLGHDVEFARDGGEAIELFCRARESGAPFDVVILDLTIRGGMGGKETVRRLREIDPSTKAIVSSGYSNDPVVADFRGFGFDGTLNKPYRMRELAVVLREMMTESGRVADLGEGSHGR